MIKSIVALIEPPTPQKNPTQPALRQAIDLSKNLNAKLTVVLCCYELAAELDTLFLKDLVHNSRQPILQHHEDWLKQLLLPYQQDQPICTEVCWSKHAYQALLELHQRDPFDLLVSQFHPHSALSFHSEDWHLLHQVPVSILLVHQAQSLYQMKILIALDTYDPLHQQRNHKILTQAKTLHALYQAKLTLCHAYPTLATYSALAIEPDPLITHAAQQAIAEAHKESCLTLARNNGIGEDSIIVREGTAYQMVDDLLTEDDFDLLMVGGQHGKGLPGQMFYHSFESVNKQRPINLWLGK